MARMACVGSCVSRARVTDLAISRISRFGLDAAFQPFFVLDSCMRVVMRSLCAFVLSLIVPSPPVKAQSTLTISRPFCPTENQKMKGIL